MSAAILLTVLGSLAQFQNPSGFQDPLGANRGGTGNPPNSYAPLQAGINQPSPSLGSAFHHREIETNSALRQELRRPFGGQMYNRSRLGEPAMPPGDGPAADSDQPVQPDPAHGGRQKKANNSLVKQPVTTKRAAGALGSDWRYAFHNGRHWYWTNDKKWTVWDGQSWIAYTPGMFARPIYGQGGQLTGYRLLPAQYAADFRPPVTAPVDSEQQLAGASGRTLAGSVSAKDAADASRPAGDRASGERVTAMRPARVEADDEVVQGPFETHEPPQGSAAQDVPPIGSQKPESP